MALQAKYQQFLARPSASDLADNSSINYITTLTTINDSAAIVKHLQAQEKQVKKKSEKIIGAIENDNALCVDVEETLEFDAGGGAFLPQLDDNLITNKTVVFPAVHIVHFDAEQRIRQIRISWDQANLLKQVNAIGKSGRAWPIRDGKDQARLISSSVKMLSNAGSEASSHPTSTRNPNDVVITNHAKRDSITATKDPHASLSLFAPRDPNQEPVSTYKGPSIAPRTSAKPGPRDYGELFASEETVGSNVRSPSPSKVDGTVLKAGAGKHFQGNRLFDENDTEPQRSPERIKTNPNKYNHFDFDNSHDETTSPSSKNTGGRQTSSKNDRNAPNWDFEGFTTPEKVPTQMRSRDERHFGYGIDQGDVPSSPPKRPIVHAPRPDAQTHFSITDQSSPERTNISNASSRTRNVKQGLELYQDRVGEGSSNNFDGTKKPLNTITNVNNGRRGQEFGPHFDMTDAPPP
ncbi:hypothetical protein LTR66_015463, partial [Elasticomyces elasticus]